MTLRRVSGQGAAREAVAGGWLLWIESKGEEMVLRARTTSILRVKKHPHLFSVRRWTLFKRIHETRSLPNHRLRANSL
jgi:hypothetical protein